MAEQRGRVRIESGQKRVRAQLGGVVVADSARTLLVWEKPYYPTYYFPVSDVRLDLLTPTGETQRSPSRGTADVHDVKTDHAEAAAAVFVWNNVKADELRGHVSLRWNAFDHWYEEDEEVYVHARDPYTRVDILQSSRHVEVFVGGVKVADSTKPRLLFETGLPVRFYLPKTDVNMELLTPTETLTGCPYKGTASYWAVTVGDERFDDIVWGYTTPLKESAEVAGFVSFYNEKVDIVVDGEPLERPKTVFS